MNVDPTQHSIFNWRDIPPKHSDALQNCYQKKERSQGSLGSLGRSMMLRPEGWNNEPPSRLLLPTVHVGKVGTCTTVALHTDSMGSSKIERIEDQMIDG